MGSTQFQEQLPGDRCACGPGGEITKMGIDCLPLKEQIII